MQIKETRRPFLVGLVYLISSGQYTGAQFLEISSEIEVTYHRPGETNAQPRRSSIVCTTDNNLWRIEHDWSQNAVNKLFFDGTNVYGSVRIIKSLPKETVEKFNSSSVPAIAAFETVRSNLTINIRPSQDGHPFGDLGENIPWLAFCSGNYLKREGRLIPLPCDALRHTPDRYAYIDKTEVFQDPFGLPKSVDLFLSKSLYLSSVEDFYAGWGTRYLASMKGNVTNLQEGVLMFHYSVTATTNVNSCTLPLRFEFSQKERDFIQNAGWIVRGIGTLTSVREVPPPQNVFDTSMQQTIVDWRFHDENAGTDANIYVWTNSFVPLTNDAALQEQFRRRVEQARRHKDAK